MCRPNLCFFALAPTALEKASFVHELIHGNSGSKHIAPDKGR
jgi:hypothetical protein